MEKGEDYGLAQFINYLSSLAEEGETALIVQQKPVKNNSIDLHSDGNVRCTWAARFPSAKVTGEKAWYGNTASFMLARLDRNKPSASSANCEYVLVMVLDDIGTKSKVPPLAPTWIMETSANNYQWGYTFREQPTKAEFSAAISAIAVAGFTDSGALNAVRNFRLPGSVNLKPERKGFRSRLVEFNPDREYTLAEICAALGVVPGPVSSSNTGYSSVKLSYTELVDDPVLKWISDNKMVLSPVNSEGWVSVVCPNFEQHSDPSDIHARYNPTDKGFCCYHEHCQHLTSEVFLKWVEEKGGPAVSHGETSKGLHESLGKALATIPVSASSIYTHAADTVIAEIDAKELGRIDRDAWFDRFVYVVCEDSYFDLTYRRIVPRKSFNALYRHYECRSLHTGRKVEASIWFDEYRNAKAGKTASGLVYAAGESALVAREGEIYGNWWRDARPQVDKTLKGDISLWFDHAKALVPDERDREHLYNLMAYVVQYPAQKINHAVLHTGKEGCGKDTLWAPLIWAVCGPYLRNRGLVDGKNIGSNFAYALESEIIILNELREPSASDRRALSNQLKPVIAAPPDTISINKKNLHPYDMLNRVFVLAFSNDQVPITLAAQDRRWFAIRSLNPIMPEKQSQKIWSWYNNGGLESIAAWLYQRDVSMFNPKAPPFDTDYKQNLIEGGMSMSEAYLVELIKSGMGEFSRGVIGSSFSQLCDRLSGMAPQGNKVVMSTLLHALEEAGWIDCGNIKSAKYKTKKHIFASPYMVENYAKAELRNIVETPSDTATMVSIVRQA